MIATIAQYGGAAQSELNDLLFRGIYQWIYLHSLEKHMYKFKTQK